MLTNNNVNPYSHILLYKIFLDKIQLVALVTLSYSGKFQGVQLSHLIDFRFQHVIQSTVMANAALKLTEKNLHIFEFVSF